VLSMVADVIRQDAAETGTRIRIKGIRRVRFRVPIRPGETVSVSLLSPPGGDGGSRHFKVTVAGETACTGMMDVGSCE